MGLFDIFGKKKRDEAYMKHERRVPEGMENIPENDPRWMVSQEFCIEKNKNVRFYYAVSPDLNRGVDEAPAWNISKVQYDLKHQDDVDHWVIETTESPLRVVRALREFERRFHEDEEFTFVEGHRSTYRAFANAHGIHFDDKGRVMEVTQETRFDKGVFLNRDSLDALFHGAAKPPALDTWEEIYRQLIDKWPASWTVTETVIVPPKTIDPEAEAVTTPAEKAEAVAEKPADEAVADETAAAETPADAETPVVKTPPEPLPPETKTIVRPVTLDDVTGHKGYGAYAQLAQFVMTGTKNLEKDIVLKPGITPLTQINLLQHKINAGFDADADKLAKRLVDVSILVGMLRGGSALYGETLGKGNFAPEGLRKLSVLGEATAEFAVKHLGVSEQDAKKISDVITRGPDPFGPLLPLEKIFAANPPPKVEPPAPAAIKANVPKRRY